MYTLSGYEARRKVKEEAIKNCCAFFSIALLRFPNLLIKGDKGKGSLAVYLYHTVDKRDESKFPLGIMSHETLLILRRLPVG